MKRLDSSRGIGRCITGAFAFVAALITSSASALTIDLPGFSCPGATATLTGTTLTITCGSSGPTAGSFLLNAPASLAAGTTTTTQVNVTRTGMNAWTTAVDVGYTVAGSGCNTLAGTLNFTAMDGSAHPIVVTTTVAGSCAVTLSAPSAGTIAGTNPANIAVVDPDANVNFQFTAGTSATNVGASIPTAIVVQRSGGTNGEFNVPFTVSGSLVSGGAILGTLTGPSGAITKTSGLLNFPPNSSTVTLSYLAPAAAPGVGQPWNLAFSLAPPTKVAGAPAQAGALAGITQNVLTLSPTTSGPPAGALEYPIDQNAAGNWMYIGLNPTEVGYSKLKDPTSFGKVSGNISIAALSFSQGEPLKVEMTISKTIGEINPNAGACYLYMDKKDAFVLRYITAPYYSSQSTGRGLPIITNINDYASAAAKSLCWAPKSEGQWYINVRHAGVDCVYKYDGRAPPSPAHAMGKCAWSFGWTEDQY